MFAKKAITAVLGALLMAGLAQAPAGADPKHTFDHHVVRNPDDDQPIYITIFKPATASESNPVPMVLHSHGWGGSRTKTITGVVETFLDAGFGVVSIDQRGHGESGGTAYVQDPTKETEDIKAVISHIAGMNWVRHDRDGSGNPLPNDPVLGAIGGSYGGGYQTMTALDEIADEGRTRFNALAPEITWFDLPESLAPQGVPRTAWDSVLYAAGARMLPQYVHESFAWSLATGQWPDGTLYGDKFAGAPDLDSEFHKHSPVWFVQRGIRIDVPILLRQGTSDNLFNLNQGLKIFNQALTDAARERSYFVAYNGGHALPNVLPAGTAGGSDACSRNFTKLTIEFFRRAFSGQSVNGLLPDRYNLTTADGSKCLSVGNLDGRESLRVKPLGNDGIVTTTGLGAPLHLSVAQGPMTVTGIPTLSGKVTSAGLDGRAFFGLAIGKTPVDAQVVQNNLMPLRAPKPVQGKRFDIELPGVVVEVPKDDSLFLTVSPVSDMSFGHGSRTPGGLELSDLTLTLSTPKKSDSGCDRKHGRGNPKGKAHGHHKHPRC